MATVVKTVRIDIGISGDAASKQKLDAISARAEDLKKAFPEYKIKIDSLAAGQKLAVFRADMKATAAEVSKPIDIQVITKKAQASLDAIDAKALKLKATWPSYVVTIDDKAAKAKMDLLAVDSKLVGDKISRNLSGSGGGGILSKLNLLTGGAPAGAGAAGAAASGGGSLLMSPAGIAALAGAAAAAIPVLAAVGTVAVGAGVGLAGFGAVAMSTYQKLTSDIAAVHNANENFQQSAGLVDTAIATSAADAKLYSAALKSLPPGLASAQKLLGNTSVTWQGLTTTQQNNVVALSQNKDALKNMFPAQKQSLAALLASKKAWEDMSPGQQAAAKGLHTISDAWGKLTTAMAPSVLSVIAEAAGFVTRAIGPLGAIAKAAVPGIKDMVGILGNGLIGFLDTVKPLIAPSLGALNNMLIAISPSLQMLVEQMVKGMPQFVRLFSVLSRVLAIGINVTAWFVEMSSKVIPIIATNFHHLSEQVDLLRGMFIHIGHDGAAIFNGIKDVVVKSFVKAQDVFLGFVSNMLHGLLSISTTMGHLPGPLGAPWRIMSAELRTAIGHVSDLKTAVDRLPTHKGVSVTVHGAGSGTITFAQQIAGQNAKGYLAFHSKGARIPGYGGGDTYAAMLEPGESVVPKHLTPAVAPFLRAHGVPGFAAGLVGAGSVLNTGEPWMGARETSAGYAAASSFGRGILNNMHQLAAKASAAAFTGAGLGGAGVARWAPLILKVLAMLQQSSANLGAVEHRMAQESGGNQRAINLTDINAHMGTPSEGLMQVIGPTFAAYRSFSLPNDIWNPISNIFAGLNYALNSPNYRGRSLSSVMMQAGGYDQGGFLPTGLSLAYNGTGRPEPVGHGGNTYVVNVNMPLGSTRAEIENSIVKVLDKLARNRRLPR